MGKRKKSSRKPTGNRKKEALATTFPCLFCNHENSVTAKLDKKNGQGELNCKVCGQHYSDSINYLFEPVDLYSLWVDACENVNQGQKPGPGTGAYGDADDDMGERSGGMQYGQHASAVEDDGAGYD